MSKLVNVIPSKTYKTKENCIKAVEDKLLNTDVRYLISQTEEGRFFPILLGGDAIRYAVSFQMCCVN